MIKQLKNYLGIENKYDTINLIRGYLGALIIPLIGLYLGWFGGLTL